MYKTALKILKILENEKYESYIVGGYVRDNYIGKKSIDIDICTSATPKDIKKIFKEVKIDNSKYGSVTITVNNKNFEITTFRKDVLYKNKRFPEIEYVKDVKTDLQRRDFTINTLLMNSSGTVIDLLNGKEDIDNKIIKIVGDPYKKIEEDALRILRAIRFSTTLNFEIDSTLKEAIKIYAKNLKELSYERKREELDKIFIDKNAEKGIRLIKELKLDKYLELNNLENLVLTDSIIGIWAQLDAINYKFNNNEKDMIKKINCLMTKELTKYNIYKYGLYISTIVSKINNLDISKTIETYENLQIHSRKDIDIKAEDICNILNKKSGPFLNDIYKDLEEKIISNELLNERKNLINYIINSTQR